MSEITCWDEVPLWQRARYHYDPQPVEAASPPGMCQAAVPIRHISLFRRAGETTNTTQRPKGAMTSCSNIANPGERFCTRHGGKSIQQLAQEER